jgi:hypothetical protein
MSSRDQASEKDAAGSPEKARESVSQEGPLPEHPGTILRRVRSDSRSLTSRDVFRLQGTIGNRATRQLMSTVASREPVIQRKASKAGRSGGGVAKGDVVQLSLEEPAPENKLEGAPLGGLARSFLNGNASGSAVRGLAEDGVRGSGGLLPHAARIQESFGGFDVSGISAHAGPGAKSANASLGSNAYAIGEKVALSAPDLWTEAHEATHVLQQRAGVRVSGGVGRPGDMYERQAHEVADRVVSGQTVEGLLASSLGQAAASGLAAGAPAVQMDFDLDVAVGDWYSKDGQIYEVLHVRYSGSSDTEVVLRHAKSRKEKRFWLDSKEAEGYQKCDPPSNDVAEDVKQSLFKRTKTLVKNQINSSLAKNKEEVLDDEEGFVKKEFEDKFWVAVTESLEGRMENRTQKILKRADDVIAVANLFIEKGGYMAIDAVKDKHSKKPNLKQQTPSMLRKGVERSGQVIRAGGGGLGMVPIIGGLASSPVVFVGTMLEQSGQGAGPMEALAKSLVSSGTALVIGSIPVYGTGAGFLAMANDVAKLSDMEVGSTAEALVRLYACEECIEAMREIAKEEGIDIEKIKDFKKFDSELRSAIAKLEAKVEKKKKDLKVKLLKEQDDDDWNMAELSLSDKEPSLKANNKQDDDMYEDFLGL